MKFKTYKQAKQYANMENIRIKHPVIHKVAKTCYLDVKAWGNKECYTVCIISV